VQKKKKFWLWSALLTLLLFILAGCGPDEAVLPPEEGNQQETPQEETVELQIFFADEISVQSGEAGTFGFVAPVTREVTVEGSQLEAALSELIKGPRPEEEEYFSVMPSTAKVLSVQVDQAVARVDFSRELLTDAVGGTLGGTVFMQAIVLTLTQFPGVEQVAVLVEGEPWSDGHFIWEQPLGPKELIPCPAGC